jgi:hypothetical protein
VLTKLPAASQAALTGRTFFPSLLSGPFHSGLIVVFSVSAALSVLAGLASLLRGKRKAPLTAEAALATTEVSADAEAAAQEAEEDAEEAAAAVADPEDAPQRSHHSSS